MKVLWRKANENASIKHKQRKDAKNEAYHEEPTVTHDPILSRSQSTLTYSNVGRIS